jgi:phage regulator Rha-like protein
LVDIKEYFTTIDESETLLSHFEIAEWSGREPRSIFRLLQTHQSDFEKLGLLRFEIASVSEEKLKKNPDAKPQKICFLNKKQSFLLISYLENIDKARELKQKVAEFFFATKKRVSTKKPLSFSSTVDDLMFDFMTLSKSELDRKYSALTIRVLRRPKDWKERVFKEWNGLNALSLSLKFKTSPQRIQKVVNEKLKERSRDEHRD